MRLGGLSITVMFLLCLSPIAWAQPATSPAVGQTSWNRYVASRIVNAYVTIIGQAGITLIPTSNTAQASHFYNLTLPFNFTFIGRVYTAGFQLGVGANGYVAFDRRDSSGVPDLGRNGGTVLICPYWSDIAPVAAADGGIYWSVDGVTPSRSLTVEWRCDGANPPTNTPGQFQAKLYEGSNRIEFFYGPNALRRGNTYPTHGAVVGLKNMGFPAVPFPPFGSDSEKFLICPDPSFSPDVVAYSRTRSSLLPPLFTQPSPETYANWPNDVGFTNVVSPYFCYTFPLKDGARIGYRFVAVDNNAAADSVMYSVAQPGNVYAPNSTFQLSGRFRNLGANAQSNVPVVAKLFRGNTLLQSFSGTAFPVATTQGGVSTVNFGTVGPSVTSIAGTYTVKIIANMVAPIDQNRADDTLISIFTIPYANDVRAEDIIAPFGYRAPTGQFSDAEYVMVDSAVCFVGRFRNMGFLPQRSNLVNATIDYWNGAAWVPAARPSAASARVAIDTGRSVDIGFGTFIPRTLSQQTINDPFYGMSPNVTPIYRLRITSGSDDNAGNNVYEKLVRFYVPRSTRSALVSVETRQAAMPATAIGKSNKLNTDTLLAALDSIRWSRADGVGAEDYDLFDRDKWPKECLDFRPWSLLIWEQGAEPQGVEPEERAALKVMLGNPDKDRQANLIIAGQDIARIHDTARTPTNGNVADQDFVRNYLRGEYRGSTNPASYNNRNTKGVAINAGKFENIRATGVAGDSDPLPAVVKPMAGKGGSGLTHYYSEQNFGSYVDSSAGVASFGERQNVVFYAQDWRHYGRFQFEFLRSGAQRILLGALDFMHQHPDSGLPRAKDTRITFTLRWNTKRTDLDLVLVRPDGQVVYWGNRRVGIDSLDGDDNNGEGPEDIVFHALCSMSRDTVGLRVVYTGPGGGARTKATVFCRIGNGPTVRIGTCVLDPGDTWDLGRFDPRAPHGLSARDATCGQPPAPLNLPRTKVVSPRR